MKIITFINPNSIPREIHESGGSYLVDTIETIKKNLLNKLKKPYFFKKYGYQEKGTLIIGIFDPAFEGFNENFELNKHKLGFLAKEIEYVFKESCFKNVV